MAVKCYVARNATTTAVWHGGTLSDVKAATSSSACSWRTYAECAWSRTRRSGTAPAWHTPGRSPAGSSCRASEEKQVAYAAWVNRLTPEQIEETFKNGAAAINEIMGRIVERVGAVSGALKTLFEKSRLAWSEADDGRHPNIDGIHHYLAKAKTANGEVYVHFTVREDNRDGNNVHSATVSSVDVYTKDAAITPGKDLAKSAPFMDDRIAYFLGRGNSASVSKVVDENGEPMVVYHVTQAKSATDNTGAFDAANPDINWRRAYTPDNAMRAMADAYGLTTEEARVMFGGASFSLAQSPLMRQTMFPTEAALVNDIPAEPGVANAAHGVVNVMRDLASPGASTKWHAFMDGLGRRLWDHLLPLKCVEEWIGARRRRAPPSIWALSTPLCRPLS